MKETMKEKIEADKVYSLHKLWRMGAFNGVNGIKRMDFNTLYRLLLADIKKKDGRKKDLLKIDWNDDGYRSVIKIKGKNIIKYLQNR